MTNRPFGEYGPGTYGAGVLDTFFEEVGRDYVGVASLGNRPLAPHRQRHASQALVSCRRGASRSPSGSGRARSRRKRALRLRHQSLGPVESVRAGGERFEDGVRLARELLRYRPSRAAREAATAFT